MASQENRFGGPLELNVLFTSGGATIAATKAAGKLAGDLGARIRIIVPQVVPFPLPISEPTVKAEFTAQRVHEMLAIDAEVRVCLCRDKVDGPVSFLKPHSVILIGRRRRLWRTETDRLARMLRGLGHEVVFIDQ
jgi:hypothetical protein